ncbi:MAG: amidohydrolase family protein [Desulfamplus sp.]|nr:amidohydrolase family protein [Desulfamplus sp.]
MERHNIDKIALISTMVDPFFVDGIPEKLANIVRKALQSKWKSIGLLMYNTTVNQKGQFSILGKVYNIYSRPDDELVAKAIEAHPSKFYGWIFVNPAAEDPVAVIDKRAGNPSWIGVKCHPFWHRYPIKMLDDTCAYCVEKRLPILLHLGGNKEMGNFRYLPERYPSLKIIYAHAGVPYYGELWAYIKNRPNIFVDISSPYLDESLRIATLKTLGAHKCIYGTDGPYGYPDTDGMYDHGAILSEIDRFPINDKEKELILGINFMEIIGI